MVFVGHSRVPLLPWPDEVMSGNGQVSKKNEQFENLGKVRLGKSFDNDGSAARVCERLVCLTGGVPKNLFRGGGRRRAKVF